MNPQDVEALLATVLAETPDEMDREWCNRRLRDLSRLRSVLDALEIRTTRRLKVLADEGSPGRPRRRWANTGVIPIAVPVTRQIEKRSPMRCPSSKTPFPTAR